MDADFLEQRDPLLVARILKDLVEAGHVGRARRQPDEIGDVVHGDPFALDLHGLVERNEVAALELVLGQHVDVEEGFQLAERDLRALERRTQHLADVRGVFEVAERPAEVCDLLGREPDAVAVVELVGLRHRQQPDAGERIERKVHHALVQVAARSKRLAAAARGIGLGLDLVERRQAQLPDHPEQPQQVALALRLGVIPELVELGIEALDVVLGVVAPRQVPELHDLADGMVEWRGERSGARVEILKLVVRLGRMLALARELLLEDIEDRALLAPLLPLQLAEIVDVALGRRVERGIAGAEAGRRRVWAEVAVPGFEQRRVGDLAALLVQNLEQLVGAVEADVVLVLGVALVERMIGLHQLGQHLGVLDRDDDLDRGLVFLLEQVLVLLEIVVGELRHVGGKSPLNHLGELLDLLVHRTGAATLIGCRRRSPAAGRPRPRSCGRCRDPRARH